MSKPLTIEELKVGEWVWVVDIESPKHGSGYWQIHGFAETHIHLNQGAARWVAPKALYGKTWLAYKNKEEISRFTEREYYYTFDEQEFDIDHITDALSTVLRREFSKGRRETVCWKNDTYSKQLVESAIYCLLNKLCLSDYIDLDALVEEYLDDIKDEVCRE